MKKSRSPKASPAKRLQHFTAKYTPIANGYVGQILEWPEVISEGRTLNDCQASLRDALEQMILAYGQIGKEIPTAGSLTEHIPMEV